MDTATYVLSKQNSSKVSVEQLQSTGTNIAKLTIDGVQTNIYAPSNGGGGGGGGDTIHVEGTIAYVT